MIFLFDEVCVHIHEKISSHNDADYKLKKSSCHESDERSSRRSQCVLVTLAGIFLSEIRSHERPGNQSDKSERSDHYSKNGKHDDGDD